MTFSQSFEFGNSTFMKLESDENHAINDENGEEDKALDIILESPTSSNSTNKFSALSLTRNRSRFLSSATQHQKANVSSNNRQFRRSKSDSTLPKIPVQSYQNTADNYSEFFRSDFSVQQDITKDRPNGNEFKNASVLRVSQIETAFNDEIGKGEVEKGITDKKVENSFEKQGFSEDLKDLLEINENENTWEDSLPLSAIEKIDENANEPPEIALEVSSFICPPKGNNILKQLIQKELEVSHRIFKESQKIYNLSEQNVSLSCMSPDQLKFSQEYSLMDTHINKTNKVLTTQVKDAAENNFKLKSSAISIDNLEALKSIKSWNLPLSVLLEYERKGVKKMFDWQIQCLSNPKVSINEFV